MRGEIMAKYTQEEIQEARKWLNDLKPGDEIYAKVTHVARSGMSRSIELYRVVDGEIRNISWEVSRLLGERIDPNHGGLRVSGCGMDMCFHTIYNLGYVLFPDGFGVEGRGPLGHIVRPQNKEKAAKAVAKGYAFYGRNGDPSGWDNDGGYALVYRSL
jgi:hypothetical protein